MRHAAFAATFLSGAALVGAFVFANAALVLAASLLAFAGVALHTEEGR